MRRTRPTPTLDAGRPPRRPAGRGRAARARRSRAASVFEVEYRFRAADGAYRWHLGRAVPIRDEDGEIDFWVGTATDIHDRKRIEEAQRFLLDAGARARAARSTTGRRSRRSRGSRSPRIADWCAIDVVEADGALVDGRDRARRPGEGRCFARELQEPLPGRPGDSGSGVGRGDPRAASRSSCPRSPTRCSRARRARRDPPGAAARARPALVHLRADDRARPRRSARSRSSPPSRAAASTSATCALAEELAQRAATAVDNARLYEEAEQRARAARVLETIADGVVLSTSDGVVLLWKPPPRRSRACRARRRRRPAARRGAAGLSRSEASRVAGRRLAAGDGAGRARRPRALALVLGRRASRTAPSTPSAT